MKGTGIVPALLTLLFVSLSSAEEISDTRGQAVIDGIHFKLADGLRIEKVADQLK